MEIYFDGTLIDSDNYISFSNEFKQFDESFMLGTTASNTITIEVPGNIAIPTNVLIKINNTNYATMIVDSYEYEDNNILKLNLVDKMVLLDFNYNAQSIVPCTVKAILQNICTQAGITLATNTFTNQDLSVDFYDNTITAREYVGMIAELNGGFARINTNGQLELVKFTGTPTDIDIETCEDFRVGEKHKIERVVFDNGLLKFETSSDETKETLYLNSQNVYINDATTFDNIANQILNFEFYCFSTGNCEINSSVRAGDLINFTDGTDNYPTIAQYSLNYVGGLNGGYELNINSQKQEETKIIGLGEQYKRLSVKIDRDKNEILETVESQIDGIEKEITPTDTSSGSSIYLEDSAETELIDFELEGETTQETRSGKNLLGIPNVNYSDYGLTIKSENGIITINGTATSTLTYDFNLISPISSSLGTLTKSLNPSGTYSGLQTSLRNNGGNSVGLWSDNAKSSTNTISADAYKFRIQINSGITINATIKPQIEVGSSATSWEQGGAMPSPQYPSELVSVGYENIIPQPTYEASDNSRQTDFTWLKELKTGTYTISFDLESFDLGTNTTVSIYFDTFNIGVINSSSKLERYSETINITSSKASSSTSNFRISQTNYNNGARLKITNIQLEKGTQVHSYIPYGKYGIEVKTNGRNIWDEQWELGLYSNADGSKVASSNNIRCKNFILCKPNKQYYLKTTVGNRICFYDKNKNFISIDYDKQNKIFTTPSNCYYMAFNLGASYGTTYNNNVCINESDKDNGLYPPYIGNTYLYTLDSPLRSIGDTKDLLYIKNGMLYVDRKIGYQKITSSIINPTYANVLTYSKEARVNATNINNIKLAWGLGLYSNCFKRKATWGVDEIGIMDYAGTPNSIAFRIPVSDDKTFFDNHNVYLQYLLNEPYTEELGQVDMPSTYKGITYLNTTDELEPNMNITYVRDTVIANYVESHVSELKINEQGIESRVQTIEESDYGSRINAVEERTTDTEHSIEVISTNIDTTTGEVRKVTTTNGMTFDENGLNIHTNQSTFNAQHTYEGTYYRDGEEVITETTINGFKATNLKNKGQHEYSYDDTNDLYEFIDERVEVDGEYCYATFYNGEE